MDKEAEIWKINSFCLIGRVSFEFINFFPYVILLYKPPWQKIYQKRILTWYVKQSNQKV